MWPKDSLQRFERLRQAGYIVTVEGHVATITGGPPPRTDPPTCPYTGTPMKPATWAPEGMTIWVPDVGENDGP